MKACLSVVWDLVMVFCKVLSLSEKCLVIGSFEFFGFQHKYAKLENNCLDLDYCEN